MTRDEIVQIAWDCGILMRSHQHQEEPTKLERFAERIAAAEREACAELCQEMEDRENPYERNVAVLDCASAIRARGEV
jgi:hypothetical protein